MFYILTLGITAGIIHVLGLEQQRQPIIIALAQEAKVQGSSVQLSCPTRSL